MNKLAPCRFLEVYGFSASSGLPTTDSHFRLTSFDNGAFAATLCENPFSQLRHIDTHSVIASRLLPGGLPSLSDSTTLEQEIKKAKARREQFWVNNVYVIFEGSTNVELDSSKPDFRSSAFNVCIDGFSNTAVAKSFQDSIQDVLCALVLSHSKYSIEKIKRVGSVYFLIDSSNKPTYNFNLSISAQVSLASPTSVEVIDDTIHLLSLIPNYNRISRLIIKSLDSDASALQSFICAWAALEIFVNATRPGKDTLRQKFASIAQFLDPSNAIADEKEFARLKNYRDSYFHSSRVTEEDFPTSSIHNLLMKYLNLRMRTNSFQYSNVQLTTSTSEIDLV